MAQWQRTPLVRARSFGFDSHLRLFVKCYDVLMNECAGCGSQTSNAKYCSRSCSVRINNALTPKRRRRAPIVCPGCNNQTYNLKFCSQVCQHNAARNVKIQEWLSGGSGSSPSGYLASWARNYIRELHHDSCEKCGWNEKHPISGAIPVQIDHIDGDPRNNTFSNLQLLCPNCHSLTPTFGAMNNAASRAKYGQPSRPSVRPERKKYRNKY